MIEDVDIERALDFLRDNADPIGRAKANSIRAGHMVKHVKALVMKTYGAMPVAQQAREAEASPEYLAAIEEDAQAAGEYEKMRSLREAAAMRIEAWRSASANFRALKL